ncbi:molybdopterin molybdotransferase MoeA [Leucobacter coleopterorum]|uniref:Molybdopterin molybdenumtransferase n=1 Tax=Leucobacter coleopterorum TaxID=2714933 RepID=A0ABX6JX36_9MICO|nr:gephyrin-like molybdotransferase Glp [Leucobacter coleopterorum]QIM18876.1 molybdopterin molybdotransferase MoeA [Leucobacter coleopterorum]
MSTDRRLLEAHQEAVRSLLTPMFESLRATNPECVSVHASELLGRVTAREITTAIPLPPFDNSQMDGYAVSSTDVAGASPEHPVILALGYTTAAGDMPGAHMPRTASPIMTGAIIPHGADSVIPVEQTLPPKFPRLSRRGDPVPVGSVTVVSGAPSGQFVRRCGEDAAVGTPILTAGVRLTPARIGALAAAGCTTVQVLPRVRVLLCSTGDEIPSGAESRSSTATVQLELGKIHDANTPMLAAALREAGAEVDTLRCGDQAAALHAALTAASPGYDLIVTSGGISAGAFEVVREALAPLGAEFMSVAMQPGGPQGLGEITLAGSTIPVVSFPGNPVSAFISAECFVLPLLREHAGLASERPREQRQLAHDTKSPLDKLQVRRGRIEADGRVTLSGPGSHLLSELAAADVLVQLPLGQDTFPENTPVETWRIND